MNWKRSKWLWMVLFAGWILFIPSAFATIVMKMELKDLVLQSELIVHGTVESTTSEWLPNKAAIISLVKIKVAKEILGRKVGSHVVIRTFGGEIDGVKRFVPGFPTFFKGREVVVVLKQSPYLPKDQYLLVGLNQGKWIIARPQSTSATLSPIAFQKLPNVMIHPKSSPNIDVHPENHYTNQSVQSLFQKMQTLWAQVKKNPVSGTAILPIRPKIQLAPKQVIQKLQKRYLLQPNPSTPKTNP